MSEPDAKGNVDIRAQIARNTKRGPPAKITEFIKLPAWVRTAITMHVVLGHSWAVVSKRTGRNPSTLKEYVKSPAVKEWLAQLEEFAVNPIAMAEATLKANALDISMEYMLAYEKAIESNDYNSVAKISQDLLDRVGITKKRDHKDTPEVKVTLNIGSDASIEVPEISASFEEVVEDADFEIED